MCKWCNYSKSGAYTETLSAMAKEDAIRLKASIELEPGLEFKPQIFSSIKYPVKLPYPFFDVRTAYCTPFRYYQNLKLDGEAAPIGFSHGSMRSIFFSGKRLMLFSKSVAHREGKEYFSNFVLLHLEPEEYHYEFTDDGFMLNADISRRMTNLLTGKTEVKKVFFNFVHRNLANRIVTRDQIMGSAYLKSIYSKYGGLESSMLSVDMDGYAITVSHIAPHPYLLNLCEQLGYENRRAMQEDVMSYFKGHLQNKKGA